GHPGLHVCKSWRLYPRMLSNRKQMYIAAIFSFVLYILIFLRMRGNIIVEGFRISFRRSGLSQWRGKRFNAQALTIAKQMLLYPIAYTILILPITASRFTYFAGYRVPFGVTIFADSIFLLDGVVNVTLFAMTRRILPPDSFKIPKWKISRPTPIPEATFDPGLDSYYQASGKYVPFDEKEDSLPSVPVFPKPIHSRDM
ncbi:unnamed protein product, partial [Mycena citricolor]